MNQQTAVSLSNESMILLSRLLLMERGKSHAAEMAGLRSEVQCISREKFDNLVGLASSNHVIVRGLEIFLKMMQEAKDEMRAGWALTALEIERARIDSALTFLKEICTAFDNSNYDVTVIKSLDHTPDLGSDLDLYSNAKPEDIFTLMVGRFNAIIGPQSWGDRLACKWNFLVPGLSEAVEIHMGRLGQTGEQVAIASRVAQRSRKVQVDGRLFRVPCASDRLMISTMQRMYRHFYFRLCDIVDTAELSNSGGIDFMDLHSAATKAGIWEGVATYLVIVSDYVKKYSSEGLDLPPFVRSAARFGGSQVYYAKEFLRVPIMPQSAQLYATQFAGLLRKHELQNTARLSLLPWLATAALVGQKITGSDKGIW
jgi:hypothetical protein